MIPIPLFSMLKSSLLIYLLNNVAQIVIEYDRVEDDTSAGSKSVKSCQKSKNW